MKSLIKNNFFIKILALIAAIFLWTYVINEGYRVDFLDTEIPIEAYNIAEDLSLTNDLGTVKIKVRAPSNVSTDSISSKTNAFIDLKNFRQGDYEKEVKIFFEDPAITLIEIEPKNVNVTLEPLTSLTKEIEVELAGEINEKYQTEEPVLSVENAEIKGAQSTLEKIDRLVASIDLSNEMTEVKKIVELEARGPDNNKITGIAINPKTVEVTIPVGTKEEIKTVGIKANISGGPAEGYWIKQTSIEPSAIAIVGETSAIANTTYINTLPIDINGIMETKQVKTGLELPENLKTESISEVSVTIEIDSQQIQKLIEVKPKFLSLSSDLKISSYDPDVICLTVTGPAPEINELKTDDLYADIDLNGKSRGTFSMPIDAQLINLPPDINVKSIDTANIKIIIK